MRSLRSKFYLIITILILLLIGNLTLVFESRDQTAAGIERRLEQQGVPVKGVTILNQFPYRIEIDLQSSSQDEYLTVDDNWYMVLARRQATFSYRTGTRVSSFKLSVYNAKDELIYSDQTYLNPQDLNQQLVMATPKVDNAAAREIVAGQLRLGGLSLDTLEVYSEPVNGSSGQILILQVSARDLEAVNASLPNFLDSLFYTLETANAQHGTYLVLCHLRVLDSQGQILLDYVRDLEGGVTQLKSHEGLENIPGLSGPKPTTPEPTPAISQEAYPAITPDQPAVSDSYP